MIEERTGEIEEMIDAAVETGEVGTGEEVEAEEDRLAKVGLGNFEIAVPNFKIPKFQKL
jgi:hypothetical protein